MALVSLRGFPVLLLCMLPWQPAAQECTQGFSVVAPELAVPGKTTAVLVTLHGSPAGQRPLNVTLRLVSDTVEEVTQLLAEVHQEIRGHGIVPLSIPAGAAGNCILQTLIDCSAPEDCGMQSNSGLRLVGTVRDVIIRPANRVYNPGETVFFWILALNHDLRVASDIIGNVFVRNPQGTKVALWQEVALDEGVKSFSLPLSDGAQLGRWDVQVEVEDAIFSSEFNVTLTGGSTSGGGSATLPEVAMAEEHYVELRFGHEMRRLYKPGLPFVGKVEAVSTEKSVRVRVKVYDNTTAIYSQDIEITSGEGTFIVPAILADSDIITLQAELVSVEGKEIDSHYVLAREPVHKWDSTSDCYLLVEGLEHSMRPDEEAHATVLSTCPCERDLHYVITTEGHVTYWSEKPAEMSNSDEPPTQNVDGAAICRIKFSFRVEAVMAPVSNLLVYYVSEAGEPVSDVISFDVKLLQSQVSVTTETRKYWYPSQPMEVQVVSQPGSLVCLLGGHAGSSGVEPRSLGNNTTTTSERPSAVKELDFLEAGLSFYQRRCVRKGSGFDSKIRFLSRGGDRNTWRHRSVVAGTSIDQLWLWKCFNYSADMGVTIPAPQDPGKWTLWALTLAPNVGLRFSPPLAVTVFRPLQVDFTLPLSLRVGESVEVDVKIGNNINSCMDVTALLALTEGSHFLSNGMLYVTEKLRLGAHGATSLVVRVVVTSPGPKNMTAEVTSSDTCRESGNNRNSSAMSSNTLVGSVVKSSSMQVHPEGLVRTDTESAYFCANENVIISTTESFHYEFVSAPRNRAGIVFEVKVDHGGAFLALSDIRYSSDRMYQVALGDQDNTQSWIGRGKHGYGVHLASRETPQMLSGDEFRTFWVSWARGLVALGEGPLLHNNTLVKWRADKKLRVQHIGFASGWGHTAEFRIWNYNDEAGFSQVLHLDVPRSVVPGTEQGSLLVAGGLALPTLSQGDSLLHRGLGLIETTSLAAAISQFTPMLTLRQSHASLANTTASNNHHRQVLHSLGQHVQTLLTFMKPDKSFGDHHAIGSHRNTVAVLGLLTRAQSFLSVDPDLLSGMKRWIQHRQAEDGSFPPLATDGSTAAQRRNTTEQLTLDRTVEVTAETLVTLLEIGLENEADSEVMLKARYFLERILFHVTSACPLAVLTHALVLGKSELSPVALERLRNASTNEEGDFGWQHAAGMTRDAPDWLYEEGAGPHRKEPIMTSVSEYKASLYALMTYSLLGDLKAAEPVARFLFYRSHLLDRHAELLFAAVDAFTVFGSLALDRHRALTVSLATSGMELTDTLELRPDTSPQSLQLPSLPTKVFVYATGAGCATVQGQVSYSTYSTTGSTPILDLWAGVEEEVIPGRNSVEQLEGRMPVLKLKTCFRWKGLVPSGVLRLEVTLFSGFQLTRVSPVLDAQGERVDVTHGSRGDNVWFVLANATGACPLCIRYAVRSNFVVGSLRPAFVRIFPVGRADLGAETFFHTRRGSPLLSDVTDDDLITWFGSLDSGAEPQLSSNFSEVCECGSSCPPPEAPNNQATSSQTLTPLVDAEATNIIVFTNHSDVDDSNTTQDVTTDINATTTTTTTTTTAPSTTDKTSPVNDVKNVTTGTTKHTTVNTSRGSNVTDLVTAGKNAPVRGRNPKAENRVKKTESEKKLSGKKLRKKEVEVTTGMPTPQPRTVNKERHRVSEESWQPTMESSHRDSEEKLFVLDRDTLWGMLREVVHVELDKNGRNVINKGSQLDKRAFD